MAFSAVILLAVVLGGPAGAQPTPAFSIIDVGTLGGPPPFGGAPFSNAFAMNASGQVVGISPSPDGSLHAFLWSKGGGMLDLGTLGGNYSWAIAVSSTGQVVGQSALTNDFLPRHGFSWTQAGGMIDLGPGTTNAIAVNSGGQVTGELSVGMGITHAYLWTQADGLKDLGTLGSEYVASTPTALSESGEIVGFSRTTAGPSHAFAWTQAGGMIDLGTLERDSSSASYASAVSDNGQVIGRDQASAASPSHAFSWTPAGGFVDLGTLGGPYSTATAVNASGEVVGSAATADGHTHAFLWTQAGGMLDLGTLGGANSGASAINDSGQIAGGSMTADGSGHAFIWTPAAGMVDLGTLGGPSSSALSVNANGQVAGNSTTADGAVHAVFWNPVQFDTTPPTLTVPAGITTDATSPLGAAVTYNVSASDTGVDTPVSCTPESGSTFPIGDTTVICSATDVAGNTGTASFTIHIKGAVEQLIDLAAAAASNGPGASLADKVHNAQVHLANGEVIDTCSTLKAFVQQVTALSDKSILPTPSQPIALITSAKQITAVLGCT